MSIQLAEQCIAYLDNHDSSPGAYCLVKSVFDNTETVSDADCDDAYNSTEGFNDSRRDHMIRAMNTDQLVQLATILLEIADEKLCEVV